MRPRAQALALVVALGAAPASARRLEVVFIAEGEGPLAYVELEDDVERDDDAGAGQLERRAAYALFAGGVAVTRSLADAVPASRRAPVLDDLPSAPAALGFSASGDGSLLVTLDDVGDWQAKVASAPPKQRAEAGPAVASHEAARLLVEPSHGQATLHGTRTHARGRASVGSSRAPLRLFLEGPDGLVEQPLELASERAFVVDRATACGGAVPSALLLHVVLHDLLHDAAPVRLYATAPAACLPSGRAVVPLAGVRVEPKGDVPLRAVLVVEQPPSVRAAFLLRLQ